ncbi:hypothetical protein QVD17_30938 [Tagetes erecta]|uniref:Uncharacterized protein n=1 Tax=Tagetes erecta TaxID=13708 RepID=A0AAD8K663_TARER|nr:hypothetical protein QVD17_30938 [Tagetes erecta]
MIDLPLKKEKKQEKILTIKKLQVTFHFISLHFINFTLVVSISIFIFIFPNSISTTSIPISSSPQGVIIIMLIA